MNEPFTRVLPLSPSHRAFCMYLCVLADVEQIIAGLALKDVVKTIKQNKKKSGSHNVHIGRQ